MDNQNQQTVVVQNTIVNNVMGRSKRMHWLYFLLIGWWLGLGLLCCIVPLFVPGLVPRAFGYW